MRSIRRASAVAPSRCRIPTRPHTAREDITSCGAETAQREVAGGGRRIFGGFDQRDDADRTGSTVNSPVNPNILYFTWAEIIWTSPGACAWLVIACEQVGASQAQPNDGLPKNVSNPSSARTFFNSIDVPAQPGSIGVSDRLARSLLALYLPRRAKAHPPPRAFSAYALPVSAPPAAPRRD